MIRKQTMRINNRRHSVFGGVFQLALKYSSYPRLFLEVFLRNNFGRRYFSFSGGLTIFIILVLFPIFLGRFFTRTDTYMWDRHYDNFSGRYLLADGHTDLLKGYEAWYVVAALFFILFLIDAVEVLRRGWKIDPVKRLDHHGDYMPIFWQIKIKGKPISVRAVETIWEPLLCFIPGYFLYSKGQHIGIVIMVCAVWYSLAYIGSYQIGDEFTDDVSDLMKSAESKRQAIKESQRQLPSQGSQQTFDTRIDAENASNIPPPPPSMGPPPNSAITVAE